MKKYKKQLIIGVGVIFILALVFWWGGDSPALHGWSVKEEENIVSDTVMNEETVVKDYAEDTVKEAIEDKEEENTETNEEKPTEDIKKPEAEIISQPENKKDIKEAEKKVKDIIIKRGNEPATLENRPRGIDNKPLTPDEKEALAKRISGDDSDDEANGDISYSKNNGMKIDDKTGEDKYYTEPVPKGMPIPIEPENTVISDKEHTCTLSVRCDTVVKNIAWLDPKKTDIVPKDGIIFKEKQVTFYEGESVFNLLLREMKKNKIHMEFVNVPIYNSAYIEGINNLYEFDCGELSGWIYKVNDWFPNYGCSRYALKEGDKVEFVYTCDLGVDVSGKIQRQGVRAE